MERRCYGRGLRWPANRPGRCSMPLVARPFRGGPQRRALRASSARHPLQNIPCFLLQSDRNKQEKWAGHSPFFFLARPFCMAMNIGELLEKTLPPHGVRGWSIGRALPRADMCASSSTSPRGVKRRGLCARQSPADAGVRGRERRFRIGWKCRRRVSTGRSGRRRNFLRFAGEEAEFRLANPGGGRQAHQGHPAGVSRTGAVVVATRAGNADDPARRHRSCAGFVPKIEWRKGNMNRELLLLVDALAREKNVAKEIVFTARSSRPLASATQETLRRGDRRAARVDRPGRPVTTTRFRRWTVVPDEEHEEPAYQIAITDAGERGTDLKLGGRHRGAARAGRVRPHWCPGPRSR